MGGIDQAMKTKLQNKILCLTMCLLILLANIHAVKCLVILNEYADRIFVCYPKDGASASALGQLQENDKGERFSEAALWKSAGEVKVSAENTGRGKKAGLYQIQGQPGAVFGNGCVCGRYFTEEESAACMLDQGLARELFGSEKVSGMEVEANGKIYQVTGILKGNLSVCAVPAGENTGFDGAAVRKQKAAQSSAQAFSLVETVLGSTDGQKVDGQLYFMTAILFYTLVFSFMLSAAGIAALKRGGFLPVCIFGICISASIWGVISGVKIAAPGVDYLPTYWSDPDFFGRIFREKAAQIQSLAAHQEFFAWQEMLHAWVQSIGAGIFAGMIFGILASYIRPRREGGFIKEEASSHRV